MYGAKVKAQKYTKMYKNIVLKDLSPCATNALYDSLVIHVFKMLQYVIDFVFSKRFFTYNERVVWNCADILEQRCVH